MRRRFDVIEMKVPRQSAMWIADRLHGFLDGAVRVHKGDGDLIGTLMRSCYTQGLLDGEQMAERRHKSHD